LGLQHVGDACHRFLESEERLAVLLAHGDEDQGLEGQADLLGIDDGVVGGDHAAAFQLAQPPVTRRQAEADFASELGDAEPPVFLKLGKDLPVDPVHEHKSSTTDRRGARKLGPSCG
jgi:hypothetical protein